MKTRSPQRKYFICILLVITATVVTLIFVRRLTRAKVLTQDSQERLIKRLPLEANEPISITKITVRGKPVGINEGFIADDDWPSGLNFFIKNKSHRFILFASIDLKFPRPPGSQGLKTNYTLVYGNPDLQLRPAVTPELSTGISPGQSATIEFPRANFDMIRKSLTERGYPPGIGRIEFSIGAVIFQDDTMWYAGTLMRRHPRDPTTWINPEISPAPDAGLRSPIKSRKSSARLAAAKKQFAHALAKPIIPFDDCHPYAMKTQPDCGVYNENCHYWKDYLNTSYGGRLGFRQSRI